MMMRASMKRVLIANETNNGLVLNRGRFAFFRKDVKKLHQELLSATKIILQENKGKGRQMKRKRKNKEDEDYVSKRIK